MATYLVGNSQPTESAIADSIGRQVAILYRLRGAPTLPNDFGISEQPIGNNFCTTGEAQDPKFNKKD